MSQTEIQSKAVEILAEQVADLDQKKKAIVRELEMVQVQVSNASSELAFTKAEVVKAVEELSVIKVKFQETLKVQGDEVSKAQINAQKAKDELDSILKATNKERDDLEAKHTELDKKLQKFSEDKKVDQALKDEKKALLSEIKKESAELEDRRAKAEGQVNEMQVLNKKFQGIDYSLKQREEGVKVQESEVVNKANAVSAREAHVASLEASLAVREKKVVEDEGLVNDKLKIVGDKETYIVKLIEENKLKDIDVSKFNPAPKTTPEDEARVAAEEKARKESGTKPEVTEALAPLKGIPPKKRKK